MRYRMCVECGQKLFRLRSWLTKPVYRRPLPSGSGFAFGPIMIYKKGS